MTSAALADLVRSVAHDVLAGRGLDVAALPATVTVQRPRHREHGDYATNLALQTAKRTGVPPRQLATWLAQELARAEGVACAEVVGPGFLNLRLTAGARGEIIREVLAAGARYGSGDALAGRRVKLAFVSANPTGPLHAGSTRCAVVGEALGRMLATSGAAVTREYHDRAADVAQHADTHARGFDLCLYLLGADQHSHTGRLEAAAPGDAAATVEVLIGQPVNLVRAGTAVRTSQREGTVVTMADLVESVGVDAARYALIRASPGSAVDVDLDVWSRRTPDNPAFAVQYAHARLANLSRNAAELGVSAAPMDLALLEHEADSELIRTIGEFGRVCCTAAQLREPHRVARYLEQLAGASHDFHDTFRVLPVGDEAAGPRHAARLALCDATRQVLRNGLALLGVSAPERM